MNQERTGRFADTPRNKPTAEQAEECTRLANFAARYTDTARVSYQFSERSFNSTLREREARNVNGRM